MLKIRTFLLPFMNYPVLGVELTSESYELYLPSSRSLSHVLLDLSDNFPTFRKCIFSRLQHIDRREKKEEEKSPIKSGHTQTHFENADLP